MLGRVVLIGIESLIDDDVVLQEFLEIWLSFLREEEGVGQASEFGECVVVGGEECEALMRKILQFRGETGTL